MNRVSGPLPHDIGFKARQYLERTVLAIVALNQIRKMRGGAQSQLMLGSDGFAYGVKFQNNAQNLRVLAAELIATKLAGLLGLTVPECDVVEVSEELVERTPELMVEGPGRVQKRCQAGLQFGSRLVGGLMPGQMVDYLPEQQLGEVKNLPEFVGMLLLDKWTCNADGRQAVFYKRSRHRRYEATFIDQGYCFAAGDWEGMDNAPLRGVYAQTCVYGSVTGWKSFEPWMSRLEKLDISKVWEITEGVPPEWYGGDSSKMEALVEKLWRQRARVPEWVKSFKESSRVPFPKWIPKMMEARER